MLVENLARNFKKMWRELKNVARIKKSGVATASFLYMTLRHCHLHECVLLLATHIHADGTYKIIWQGHTLLLSGTTDQVDFYCIFIN